MHSEDGVDIASSTDHGPANDDPTQSRGANSEDVAPHGPDPASPATGDELILRRARTSDVPRIKSLIDQYAGRILLEKNLVTLYEAVQEFWVGELDGRVVGCGALHVLWGDLGEVRTVAVDKSCGGRGVGHRLVARLLDVARELQLSRVFVLTFETEFFGRHGFREIEGTPVTREVFEEMCRSYDTGVAEFLDLSYVKPNTLGNTRMLVDLDGTPTAGPDTGPRTTTSKPGDETT